MKWEERLARGAISWITYERLTKKKAQHAPVRISLPLAVGVSLEGRPASAAFP
jgi:hypothetical protein